MLQERLHVGQETTSQEHLIEQTFQNFREYLPANIREWTVYQEHDLTGAYLVGFHTSGTTGDDSLFSDQITIRPETGIIERCMSTNVLLENMRRMIQKHIVLDMQTPAPHLPNTSNAIYSVSQRTDTFLLPSDTPEDFSPVPHQAYEHIAFSTKNLPDFHELPSDRFAISIQHGRLANTGELRMSVIGEIMELTYGYGNPQYIYIDKPTKTVNRQLSDFKRKLLRNCTQQFRFQWSIDPIISSHTLAPHLIHATIQQIQQPALNHAISL
jgi:hypothetical protein